VGHLKQIEVDRMDISHFRRVTIVLAAILSVTLVITGDILTSCGNWFFNLGLPLLIGIVSLPIYHLLENFLGNWHWILWGAIIAINVIIGMLGHATIC